MPFSYKLWLYWSLFNWNLSVYEWRAIHNSNEDLLLNQYDKCSFQVQKVGFILKFLYDRYSALFSFTMIFSIQDLLHECYSSFSHSLCRSWNCLNFLPFNHASSSSNIHAHAYDIHVPTWLIGQQSSSYAAYGLGDELFLWGACWYQKSVWPELKHVWSVTASWDTTVLLAACSNIQFVVGSFFFFWSIIESCDTFAKLLTYLKPWKWAKESGCY